jgi:Nucleoside-diphosphate-sugar epimerases
MSAGRGCVSLTGGTGFLGQYIVKALAGAGWRVRLLVRRPRPAMPDVEQIAGTLSDREALGRLLAGADALVHAAGLIKTASPADFMTVNRDGSRLLAEMALRHVPSRVVVVSSLAAREPGLSDYAASKRAGEDAFLRCGLDGVVIVRPTAIYGPGDRETAVFLRAAEGPVLPVPRVPGGRVTMIHAADCAAAVAALCAPGPKGCIFELSDRHAEGYSWRELAREILAAAGSRARILEVPAGVFRAVAALNAAIAGISGRAAMLGPGKVRELFHADWSSAGERQPPADIWRPGVELRDGLAQTVRWLRHGA